MKIDVNVPESLVAMVKSWKSTLVGVAALTKAGTIAYWAGSVPATVHNPQFQLFLIVGVLGLIAKDLDVDGGDKSPVPGPTEKE